MPTPSKMHSIECTSPRGKGQKFIGTCRLCGTPDFGFEDMNSECPNQRGLTADEALIEAIETPNEKDTLNFLKGMS